MPKISPARSVSPAANDSTTASTRTAGTGSRLGGSDALIARTAHTAATMPIAPPIAESATLSTSSCRSTRLCVAPIATRTAISFCRDADRESSRFAMFAQAMSSTKATAPSSTSSPVFSCALTKVSKKVSRCTPQSRISGYAAATACAIVSNSACAC